MNDTESCCRLSVDEELIIKGKTLLQTEQERLEAKAKLFSLLGSEVRLKIVKLFLSYERMCVCDLSDVLEMKQSPISQHLRKLKDGGLLLSKREGMTIFYSINPTAKVELMQIVEG